MDPRPTDVCPEGLAAVAGANPVVTSRTLFPGSLLASLLAHAAIALAILGSASPPLGSGTVDLDDITVTIVTERDEPTIRATAGGTDATATPSTNPIVPASTQSPPPAAPDTAEPVPTAIEQEMTAPDHPPKAEDPLKPERTPNDSSAARAQPQPVEERPAQTASSQLVIGGRSSGESAASRGEIERHAREVALVLARNRPKGIGEKGRVLVEFQLSADDGTLRNVRIVKSSGSQRLDGIANSVVERGRYPKPPSGLLPEQLTFRIPFQFD